MTVSFDFENVTFTEFGVGRDEKGGEIFVLLPTDSDVQVVLQEMGIATREEMKRIGEADTPTFEASEKYGSSEYVSLPLQDEMAEQVRFIHEAKNLAVDSKALSDPSGVFCYF